MAYINGYWVHIHRLKLEHKLAQSYRRGRTTTSTLLSHLYKCKRKSWSHGHSKQFQVIWIETSHFEHIENMARIPMQLALGKNFKWCGTFFKSVQFVKLQWYDIWEMKLQQYACILGYAQICFSKGKNEGSGQIPKCKPLDCYHYKPPQHWIRWSWMMKLVRSLIQKES